MAIQNQPGRSLAEYGIIVGVILVIAVVLLLTCLAVVPAGTIGVLLNQGATIGNVTLGGGWHLILPVVQSVVLMNTRVQAYSVLATAASQDLQNVNTTITLNFHIDPSRASQIYNKYGDYYIQSIISPAIQESVKAATANYTATQLIDERPLVALAIQNKLTQRLSPYSLIVDQVSITDFQFSSQFSAAIEAKASQQQKLQQQLINLSITEVQANQTIAKSRGNATAVLIKANATAGAAKLIQDAIAKSPDYIKFLVASEWNGRVPAVVSTSGNGAIPLLNINVSAGTSSNSSS